MLLQSLTFNLSSPVIVWRIIVGVSLIPAFATLYQRLTLPESTRFLASQEPTIEMDDIETLKREQAVAEASQDGSSVQVAEKHAPSNVEEEEVAKKAHIRGMGFRLTFDGLLTIPAEFISYFSEWRHAKHLIGTCSCWFLLDIA